MNSDVMSTNDEMVEKTNTIYGSNRIDYVLYVLGLCGNERVYANTELEEMSHTQVTYDVTQRFPEDKLVQALKATQTELAQVHGAPSKFQYCQFPFGVEFILSKMAGVNPININAGIIKELLKSYDHKAWVGDSNPGVVGNPNAEETTETWSNDWATFKTALDGAMSRLRTATDITSENYESVTLGISETVHNMLTQVDNYNVSNFDKLMKAYPGVVVREIPTTLVKIAAPGGFFHVCYRPMLTMHRGALPGVDAEETRNYGKSLGTLYAYESTAVEVEKKGALQNVTLTSASAAKAKK